MKKTIKTEDLLKAVKCFKRELSKTQKYVQSPKTICSMLENELNKILE